MAQYYFTVASLPVLIYDEQPFYTSTEIAEICLRDAHPRAASRIRQSLAYFDDSTANDEYEGVLQSYHRWERDVRSCLRAIRAQNLGWEPPEDIGLAIEPESERIAREATSQESPHEAERLLQQARWHKLEELSVGHYFDDDSIIIYILKALVIERNRLMETETGAERFNQIYSNMVQALT